MKIFDHYRVLELPLTATPDEAKEAYRRLARKYHPDISDDPEAEAKMAEINTAYDAITGETLSPTRIIGLLQEYDEKYDIKSRAQAATENVVAGAADLSAKVLHYFSRVGKDNDNDDGDEN